MIGLSVDERTDSEKLAALNQEYVNGQLLIEKHRRFIKDLKEQLKDLIVQIEGAKEVQGNGT